MLPPTTSRWRRLGAKTSDAKATARSHRTAGSVATKINAGQYADAERLIGAGSAFAQVSTEVATILTRAKRGM